jgi:hypothetical protein
MRPTLGRPVLRMRLAHRRAARDGCPVYGYDVRQVPAPVTRWADRETPRCGGACRDIYRKASVTLSIGLSIALP